MRIHVTQDDIRKGCRCNSALCPVARAVARATGQSTLAGSIDIRSYTPTCRLYFRVKPPKSVVRFIAAFDAGKPVKPFAFNLAVPKGKAK